MNKRVFFSNNYIVNYQERKENYNICYKDKKEKRQRRKYQKKKKVAPKNKDKNVV